MKNVKMKILFLVILILSLGIAACNEGENTKEEEKFKLYYLDESSTKLEAVEYSIESEDIKDIINEVLNEMLIQRENYNVTIPKTVQILSYELSSNNLSINFSAGYNNLDNISEIFLRASVVLTLTQLDEVEYVSIYVDNKPLKDANGATVGMLAASDFIDKVGNTLNNYETTTVTLYFANLRGNSLKTEIRTGMYDSSKSLERYIVEQLIKGPAVGSNYETLPKNTEILSINTSNGICYIDFDSDFAKGATSVKDEIMIYSLVNSLTELSYINKVQISVEGEVDISLHNKVSLDTLFYKDLSYMED